jgi:hypothetical protein
MMESLSQSKYGIADMDKYINRVSQAARKMKDADFIQAVIEIGSDQGIDEIVAMRERQSQADREYARTAPNRQVRGEAEASSLDAAKTAASIRQVANNMVGDAERCQKLMALYNIYIKNIIWLEQSAPVQAPSSTDTPAQSTSTP